MVQPRAMPNSLLTVDSIHGCDYGATANNQLTINAKDFKNIYLLSDLNPDPPSPSRTYAFTVVATW